MYSKMFFSDMLEQSVSEQQQQIRNENASEQILVFQATVSALLHTEDRTGCITIIEYCNISYSIHI